LSTGPFAGHDLPDGTHEDQAVVADPAAVPAEPEDRDHGAAERGEVPRELLAALPPVPGLGCGDGLHGGGGDNSQGVILLVGVTAPETLDDGSLTG
jgi:hypothetical protein